MAMSQHSDNQCFQNRESADGTRPQSCITTWLLNGERPQIHVTLRDGQRCRRRPVVTHDLVNGRCRRRPVVTHDLVNGRCRRSRRDERSEGLRRHLCPPAIINDVFLEVLPVGANEWSSLSASCNHGSASLPCQE